MNASEKSLLAMNSILPSASNLSFQQRQNESLNFF